MNFGGIVVLNPDSILVVDFLSLAQHADCLSQLGVPELHQNLLTIRLDAVVLPSSELIVSASDSKFENIALLVLRPAKIASLIVGDLVCVDLGVVVVVVLSGVGGSFFGGVGVASFFSGVVALSFGSGCAKGVRASSSPQKA